MNNNMHYKTLAQELAAVLDEHLTLDQELHTVLHDFGRLHQWQIQRRQSKDRMQAALAKYKASVYVHGHKLVLTP